MKLNIECIRTILIYLENKLSIDINKKTFNQIDINTIYNDFTSIYSKEDIWYSIFCLYEEKMIEGDIKPGNKSPMYFCRIENITWKGHQFLAKIKPESFWNKIKQGINKFGINTITSLLSYVSVQGFEELKILFEQAMN